MRIAVFVAVALLGCEREGGSVDSDCGSTAVSLIKALQAPNEKPPADTQTTLTRACTDDRWTTPARECLSRARTFETVDECRYTQLTRQQDDHVQPILEAIDPGPAEVVAAMERLWTKMCACKDAACATAVSDELGKWTAELNRKRHSPPRMRGKKRDQVRAITEQFSKCMARAYGTPP